MFRALCITVHCFVNDGALLPISFCSVSFVSWAATCVSRCSASCTTVRFLYCHALLRERTAP